MKTRQVYVCEKCGLELKTEDSCKEHEKLCWKRYNKVKTFSCSFNFVERTFHHSVYIYSKALIENGIANIYDGSIKLKLNSIMYDEKEDTFSVVFYTDKFFSDKDQEDIFNKMHEIIFQKIEKHFDKIKETLNSKEFIECKSGGGKKFEELKIKEIDY